jgi:hypothetical protein
MTRHLFLKIFSATVAGLLCLFTYHCTDSDIYRALERNRISLTGRFCTEPPSIVTTPVKILFVVDVSASMATSDPDKYRSLAIQQVVERYEKQHTVSIGVIRFSSDSLEVPGPQVCSYPGYACTTETIEEVSVFTNDHTVLNNAILSVGGAFQGTCYLETLQMVHQVIYADIEIDPDLAATTKYMVIFLSDGVPCPAEPKADILNLVRDIEDLGRHAADKFIMHTALIEPPSSAGDQCGNSFTAAEILEEMADAGTGDFQHYQNPEDIDHLQFVEAEVERVYELIHVVAENRNARLAASPLGLSLSPDSDGDGLADDEELEAGTNPLNWDTDQDGCGDKLELSLVGFDPLVAGANASPQHCYCPTVDRQLDTDGDGLKDCEEFYLGTSKYTFDSDGDWHPDGLEHRNGSNPGYSDFGLSDYDGDGTSDWEEVWMHRHPQFDERTLTSNVDFEIMTYDYIVEQDGTLADGTKCYIFEVLNIPVVHTQAIDAGYGPDGGQNNVEITFVQVPSDDPDATPTIRFGRFLQFYFMPNRLVPARDTIVITPDRLEMFH